jgi:hypothetical protein
MSAGSLDSSSRQFTPRSPSGPNDRRDVMRLAKALTLAAALLAALTVGVVIGGAARKRLYRATHGYA